jgi:PhnB protein
VTDSRAAIEFYTEVFGAEVVDGEIFEMDDGRIGHASLKIGGSDLYLADEFPEMNILGPQSRGGGTVAIVIDVDDADETYEHAIAAGGTAERPVANQHGARSGWFSDPWGHRWSPRSPAKPDAD